MSDRSCKTLRFYMPNVGMRGEPYCDRLKKWVGTTLCCTEWQPKKPKTNADRIRSMTDEELAEWIERIRVLCANDACGQACPLKEICYSMAESPIETLDWLKQEVE